MTRAVMLTMLLSLGACASSTPPSPAVTEPSPAVSVIANPLTVDARQYASLFENSVEVLRDYGFRVDRRDFRFGIVTSRPDGSPTMLEPWRGDNRTVEWAVWSTLSDLRRVVTVTLDPQPDVQDRSTYELSVVVEVQREQKPLRRLDGSGSKRQFVSLTEVPEEWARRGVTATSWENIGRDEALEQVLLHAIVERGKR